MSYLLDKKLKRKKLSYIASLAVVFVILFYFRAGIFNGLSHVSSVVFHPFLTAGNGTFDKLSNIPSFFVSKNSLTQEIEDLKTQLGEIQAQMSNYDSILDENTKLKEILGRKNEKVQMTLAAILMKPNQSPYDTLVIDAGTKQGIEIGDKVFAKGDIPIGRVELVYASSAKVVLFSNSGEKTNVVISLGHSPAGEAGVAKDIFMEIIGRGGGNFEMILPRDVTLQKGDQAVLPGINPYVVATVETIISDPRDSFQKALLVSPVNIQELKFVQVETK